jgi:hypothetical protein
MEQQPLADRDQKLRQAAFFYLLVGVLYEAAVYVIWKHDLLPPGRGGVWVWLLGGAAIVALVFWLLWKKRSVWTARIICVLHAFRLPALIEGAFLGGNLQIPPSFYMLALIIVILNLVMLARAGWDL